MEQERDLPEMPYVRPGTGRLVRILHLSPDHKAEIYEKPESFLATQYLFIMVVLSKDRVVGMLASEDSLVANALVATLGMKPPEKTKAALISYHGTHRVNHGISEDFCTLDGFKSAAASTALDLIFPNTKGQMYYIDAKDPIADPHGIPEEYLAQFASLRSPQGATQKATPMDPEVKKALEHMYVVSLGLLSTGKSGNEVLQKLTELGCPRDVAEKCLEAAAATLSEQQGSAHSSSAQLPRAATTTPERSTAGNSSGVARSFGTTNILIGLGLLMLGGLITGVSYSAAIGGGRYVITTGLFLVGGYQVLKGLYRLLVNR